MVLESRSLPGIRIICTQNWYGGKGLGAVSSAVERLPYKQDDTGSIPVPPIPINKPNTAIYRTYKFCPIKCR
jgi:hypothetical protein